MYWKFKVRSWTHILWGVRRKHGRTAINGWNYTRNEWRFKLHSKRVKIQATLETSENSNYIPNEWRFKLHSKRVKCLGLSRMLTFHLQSYGFSCCFRDLLIKDKNTMKKDELKSSEDIRTFEIHRARKEGWNTICGWWATLVSCVVFHFARFERSFWFTRFECIFSFTRFEWSFYFSRFECSF